MSMQRVVVKTLGIELVSTDRTGLAHPLRWLAVVLWALYDKPVVALGIIALTLIAQPLLRRRVVLAIGEHTVEVLEDGLLSSGAVLADFRLDREVSIELARRRWGADVTLLSQSDVLLRLRIDRVDVEGLVKALSSVLRVTSVRDSETASFATAFETRSLAARLLAASCWALSVAAAWKVDWSFGALAAAVAAPFLVRNLACALDIRRGADFDVSAHPVDLR
ncbi:MAG: hypothetical protein ACOY0T_40635 [Myxococcota bacterium]